MRKQLQTGWVVVFSLLLMFSMQLARAGASGPDDLIKQTSDKVLKTLKDNKAAFDKDPELIYTMVNEIILPHLDFRAMSKLALGKNWRTANAQQQERFVDAFRTMLVRTYSKSLTTYTDQKIEFLPYAPPEEGKITVTVKTQVIQDNGPAIPIDYRLRIKDNEWKVYDIQIDGISLVTNYRNSFASDIRKVGMDGLIEKLDDKNRKTSS
ncbi:MAG: ABC transporter substrate-binding protein [Gammaproteobacteria bacterium]|nr:ABC transporter substrate-binding protein [Gammaproteobacteria bacterium]